jgi:type I restriction enzyme S subunit
MKTNQKIPKLRFPGFSGDWEEDKLGAKSDFFKGKGISKSEVIFNGKTECILYGELYTIYSEAINKIHSRTNASEDGLIFSIKNDVIIPASGESQIDIARAACVQKSGIALGGDLNIIRSSLNGIFLSYYLNSSKKKDIAKLSQGVSVVHLYSSQLKTLKIHFPSPPEQQKIADFLTAIDQRIQQLRRKKELLEQYKKGCMQQIFSQKIRFKDADGKEFPDWEEKRLGDCYSFKTTNSLSRDNLNYESGVVKNIHYGDIHTKFNSHFEIATEDVPYINVEVDLSTIKEESYLKEGDLVFADASEDYSAIGKCIEIINLGNERVVAGLHTLLGRKSSDEIVKGFITYLMQSRTARLSIMRIAQGAKVLGISAGRLSNLFFAFPKPPEQQKIADFLTAIDQQINAIATQLEQTETYKKGLLQQLFV